MHHLRDIPTNGWIPIIRSFHRVWSQNTSTCLTYTPFHCRYQWRHAVNRWRDQILPDSSAFEMVNPMATRKRRWWACRMAMARFRQADSLKSSSNMNSTTSTLSLFWLLQYVFHWATLASIYMRGLRSCPQSKSMLKITLGVKSLHANVDVLFASPTKNMLSTRLRMIFPLETPVLGNCTAKRTERKLDIQCFSIIYIVILLTPVRWRITSEDNMSKKEECCDQRQRLLSSEKTTAIRVKAKEIRSDQLSFLLSAFPIRATQVANGPCCNSSWRIGRCHYLTGCAVLEPETFCYWSLDRILSYERRWREVSAFSTVI